MTGWVKLHRSIFDPQGSFRSLNILQKLLAIFIVVNANHKDNTWYDPKNGLKVEVKRGELVTSFTSMKNWFADSDNVTEMKLRTAIKKLEKLNFITKRTTNSFTVLNVVNYSVYQNQENENNGQNNGTLTDPQRTLNGPLTTNNNDKNIKNEKEVLTPQKKEKPILKFVPEDWEPTQALIDWALGKYPSVSYQEATERFLNHHISKGNKFADIGRAWQNWISKTAEYSRNSARSLQNPQPTNNTTSRIARLLSARAIFNRFEPQVLIPREELETREGLPDSIFYKGKRIVDSEYEPVA